MSGYLIAIEGIDGVGKSTLASSLHDLLRQRGHTVTLTSEPTHGRHRARAVMGDIEASTLDRAEHVEQVIAPALERGDVVITDRYIASGSAYGCRTMKGALLDFDAQCARFPTPDLWLYVRAPLSLCRVRIESRGEVFEHVKLQNVNARMNRIFREHHEDVLRLCGGEPCAWTVANEIRARLSARGML